MADYIKFTVVAEVGIPKAKLNDIESWGEDITGETYIASVIKDHVADKGLLCKLDVIEGEVYSEVREYAYEVLNNKAVEELEREILEAKNCANGICED
jgi:NAD-dependent DNA ligase